MNVELPAFPCHFKTHVTGSKKTYSIFGILDFPLFETGDSGFYGTSRVSFGIESMSGR